MDLSDRHGRVATDLWVSLTANGDAKLPRVSDMQGNNPVVRRGSGLPVIFVHGHGVDHRFLLPLDDAFDGLGLERLYFDLPGFGETPALSGEAGLPELASWLVERVSEATTGEFAIVGNSIGGLLARHVCAQLAPRAVGICLLAPVVFADPGARDTAALDVVARDEDLLASLSDDDREHFTEMAAVQTRASWDRYRRWVLPGIQAADKDAMERLSAHYQLPRVPEQDWPTFEGPSLIITGKQDNMVGYRDQFGLLSHYPQASYAAIDGAGHNVHIDRPEIVAALLTDWARRLT